MSYTMIINEGLVIRNSDGKEVAPAQSAHDPDFLAYREWAMAGNAPAESYSREIVPILVDAWQIRRALNAMGLRQAVEQAVANSDDQDIKDGWEFATALSPTDPFVLEMAEAVGLTTWQVQELFTLAKTL